ncbi:hypothetical protein EMCG_00172 [[Emmonsia] crescens]|uniref:Aminoglycoside phosphotransferase domain-containing protein n=1 Tax=[Emmonsia] crescens TaxID=73230 RepID=A0A0G2ICW1_9EURO|nr:hypothetical protein EMCG_00172 [Emmonsia crescens UAMH 3008]
MDFLDSPFFTTKLGDYHSLPTPAEARARSPDYGKSPRPKPVKFEHLNLIVKLGPRVVLEEAICLRLLRKVFSGRVPVPEVCGWRVEDNCVFIYMELIPGETLQNRWDHLNDQERLSICTELKDIVSTLRQVEQDPADPFIGSVIRGPLHDYVFGSMPLAGPFKTTKEFHDWLSTWLQLRVLGSIKYPDPYQEFLPDDGTIKFTHGDLHRENIMISSTSPPRVLAVIDWTHAGWYPDYWEYCKAMYTSDYAGEWRNIWIPKFLDQYAAVDAVFGIYVWR